MKKTKLLSWKLLLVGALNFSCISSVIYTPQVQAQSVGQRIQSLLSSQKKKLGTASGRSRGGAIRGECPAVVDTRLIALAPDTNLGATVEGSPTFWFYIPYSQSMGVEYARFVLSDPQGGGLKQPIWVELPETPGIVKLNLPEDKSIWVDGKSLKAGHKYNWSFSVICDNTQPAGNPTISGWIERVELSSELESQLEKENSARNYLTYLEEGIWYEAIDQLVQNRDIYIDDWTGLLSHYKLPELSSNQIGELRLVGQ
ncbi:MAG: DUF928 domain-containing protein [Coleofasciculaceae cyanobacterium]